jgi:hypothetical protein
MTREQAREAAAVMLGWADGKEVQWRGRGTVEWNDFLNREGPVWILDNYDYRLKPTATLRPWTADEVPLGSQCRTKGDTKRFLIVRTSDESTREEWLNKCEHSTDGGKTWLPCGVEEVGK